MKRLKERWEIQKNWQLLFPILGAGLNLLACYIVSRGILSLVGLEGSYYFWYYAAALSIVGHFVMLRFFFWCFKKLENKSRVDHKCEMIAIFIVFAITGSLSGKLAGPLVEWLGLDSGNVGTFLHWTARIFLILPIYQLILVIVGWLFGQFRFFWEFEKKMLRRMGLGFLVP